MKTFLSIRVDSINYKTWKPIPNATVFKERYTKNLVGTKDYKFYEQDTWPSVKNDLDKLKLNYMLGYGLELETDEELKSHAACILDLNADHNVAEKKTFDWIINTAMVKKGIAKDIDTQEFFVGKKAKSFFEKQVPDMTFAEVKAKKSTLTKYYHMTIPLLNYPMEIFKAEGVVKLDNDCYDAENSLGLLSFSTDGLAEIRNRKFLLCNKFSFKGKEYKSCHNRPIASGAFTYDLMKALGNDAVSYLPMTLDLVQPI